MAPDPEMIEAMRRAAALWTHWGRGAEDAVAGAQAILDEVSGAQAGTVHDERWRDFVLALLSLGGEMVKAAEAGRTDEYLAYVLRSATFDESTGTYRP